MGIVSAVFGGIVRDVLTNEVPLIFRKEIYASACLIGGLTFLLLSKTHKSQKWQCYLSHPLQQQLGRFQSQTLEVRCLLPLFEQGR